MLHVINDLESDGGAQRIVRDLVALHAGRVTTSVLTLHPVAPAVAAELRVAGVEQVAIRTMPPRTRDVSRLVHQHDVTHVHLFPSLYLATLIPGPRLFTEHNTWNRRMDSETFRLFDRFVYRRYDRVVCISEATERSLSRWLGAGGPPMTVIPNGIRLDRFSGTPRSLGDGEVMVAMIARFVPQKDQATLIRALGRLPERVRLLLVGEGPLRRDAEALVRTLGLGERVEFRAPVPAEEMPQLLGSVDLYVQSSHWEGFGLVAVEAMASGLPVVASRVPGLSDVVGSSMPQFDAGDDAGLARTVQELLSPPAYEALSAAAVERSRWFTAETMADAYLELYRELHSLAGL
ncbi:MAG: glycosyltransferase family 4 protein [Candidatus Eisenbacteria bacterium]